MSIRSVLAAAMALAAAPLTMSTQGLLPNNSAAADGAMSDFGNGRGMQQIAAAGPALAGPTHAAGNAIELRGTGAQVYTCEASPSGFSWHLKAPEATLLDGAGAEFGRHFERRSNLNQSRGCSLVASPDGRLEQRGAKQQERCGSRALKQGRQSKLER